MITGCVNLMVLDHLGNMDGLNQNDPLIESSY